VPRRPAAASATCRAVPRSSELATTWEPSSRTTWLSVPARMRRSCIICGLRRRATTADSTPSAPLTETRSATTGAPGC
jgi:hypothetical protein